jgi:hypothetical protein
MHWRKLGIVYKPDGNSDWARSHAMTPTPTMLSKNRIRVYISMRDASNVGRAGYVDVAAGDPLTILNVSKRPVLDIGLPGTFDDNGVLPTCIVDLPDGRKYMYYVGFELSLKIRYRLFTGLAVSYDTGLGFERRQKTPILDRSDQELYFRGGPFVRWEEPLFKLWYVAGSSWTKIGGKQLPVYVLKYAESDDGIHWPAVGKTVLALSDPDEHGFGRPYIIKEEGVYRLFFSVRRRSLAAYRLGYAESEDGIHWQRKDTELGLDVSPSGWDSEAIMYAAVIKAAGNTYLFYNGNNFGETGFGVAVLEQT